MGRGGHIEFLKWVAHWRGRLTYSAQEQVIDASQSESGKGESTGNDNKRGKTLPRHCWWIKWKVMDRCQRRDDSILVWPQRHLANETISSIRKGLTEKMTRMVKCVVRALDGYFSDKLIKGCSWASYFLFDLHFQPWTASYKNITEQNTNTFPIQTR